MKIKRGGVIYGAKSDRPICDCIVVDPGDATDDPGERSLYRTKYGHFYLCKWIRQVEVDGDWRNYYDTYELPGFGIHTLPSTRLRTLSTITPITRDEAYRLVVQSVLPEEFQADAMKGLQTEAGVTA